MENYNQDIGAGSVGPGRVLLVDDSRSVRQYVQLLLSQAGYEVVVAEDGASGLAAIEGFAPDVVLLDLEMPVLNGFEVLERLSGSKRLFSIIMFTTRSSVDSIVDGLSRGADDYIAKPFKDEELLARVSVALRIAKEKRLLDQARYDAEQANVRLTQAQQQLVDDERARALAQLAAGAAHQINNPLGYMISNLQTFDRYCQALFGFVDEAMQGAATGISEAGLAALATKFRLPRIRTDSSELLSETLGGAKRIARIVKGLGELELGLVPQQRTLLDLNAVLYGIISTLGERLPNTAKIDWHPAPEPLWCSGMLSLLNHAFSAIVDNALDALPEVNGRIEVRCERFGAAALVSVLDNGAGMTPAQRQSVMQPFYSTKSPEFHCGLGLTIAERFFALHGGYVSFDAAASPGVCAQISLPLAVESEAAEVAGGNADECQ